LFVIRQLRYFSLFARLYFDTGCSTPKLTTHDVMPADNKKAPLSDASFLSVFI